jgi:hypothetical protein
MIAAADGKALLIGQALAYQARSEHFDLLVAIDISQSAGAPTGGDVDGDGSVGTMRGGYRLFGGSDDAGDSVLAAQLLATRTLVSQLDPATTRVGLVAFAGDDDPRSRDAIPVLPLTSDFKLVGKALDYLRRQTPQGRTNIAAAIDTGVQELLGAGRARSRLRDDATRVLLLMTDGQPTLPYPGDVESNRRWTLDAGRRAQLADVRIDSFAIGVDANQQPSVLESLSAATGGRFTAVLQPAELVSHFEHMRVTSIEEVAVRNRTTGTPAEQLLVESDGRFAAVVDLKEGENVVELTARETGGNTAVRLLMLSLAREGKPPTLYPRWAQARTRMLENELASMREKNIELEAQAAREIREWMRQEAAEARERARSLQIRVDEGEGAEPSDEPAYRATPRPRPRSR